MRRLNAMEWGEQLIAPTLQPEIYQDDTLHPQVRYFADGFAGFNWWLVATPLPGNNTDLENPMLWHGDTNGTDLPTSWTATAVVEDTPATGYNSDPAMYLENGKLYIFWRSASDPDGNALGNLFTVYGRSTTDGVNFSAKHAYCGEPIGSNGDTTMCPIIVEKDGNIKMYSVDVTYSSNDITDPIGVKGLAIWNLSGNLDTGSFVYDKTVYIDLPTTIDFWHFDLFSYNSQDFVIFTDVSANEIYIGISDGDDNFKINTLPLISQEVTRRYRYYKPTGVVLNGIFNLIAPAVIVPSPVKSRLYAHKIEIDKLLNILNDSVSFIK